jgi:uncharacterized protein YkvS
MSDLTVPEWEAIQALVSPLKSRRMKIIKSLQQILLTITVDRGYSCNIKDVRTDAKSWRDISAPETPILFIIDDMVQITRHAGKTREYTWTVKLFGVLKETTLEEFEEFIADVEQCIEDNSHLAGTVNKAEINQVITDNQLFDNTNTRLFEMDIQCEYIRCVGSPR